MLLSSLGLGLHQPQLFRSKRPVDRALGFCHSLGFDGSSAPYGNACVERDRPFPHVPPDALDDRIFDAAIFHVVKNRSGVFASGMGILPRSSSCRQPLNECRQKLPLCIPARSAGLCARTACDASSPWRRLAMRRTLRGLMSAPTGPFSEYVPEAAGIKRLPAYTCQPSGFTFRVGRYLDSHDPKITHPARQRRGGAGAIDGQFFGALQPAASASSTEQNHRLPESILIFAYQRSPGR
jgi:hypothetical protein